MGMTVEQVVSKVESTYESLQGRSFEEIKTTIDQLVGELDVVTLGASVVADKRVIAAVMKIMNFRVEEWRKFERSQGQIAARAQAQAQAQAQARKAAQDDTFNFASAIQKLITSVQQATTSLALQGLVRNYDQLMAEIKVPAEGELLQEIIKLKSVIAAKGEEFAKMLVPLKLNAGWWYMVNLSECRVNCAKGINWSILVSKREKILTIGKVIAYLHGADRVKLTERDIEVLDSGVLQAAKDVLKKDPELNAPDFGHKLQKIQQTFKRYGAASYKFVLARALSDCSQMCFDDSAYGQLFKKRFGKTDTETAINGLHDYLIGKDSKLTLQDMEVLNDGALKDMIVTTLGYFSDAPSFDQLMDEIRATAQAQPQASGESTPRSS